jgi:tryptophan synthase alpha chain
VGFGISSAAQAKDISAIADGIVIGSAVVKLIDENKTSSRLIEIVSDYARDIKKALR